jgi:BirA family transcriptional regulator, biotin operon repressor / biotin---[acetyl-CoA-carboxylase] ligase
LPIGHAFIELESVDSTNNYAMEQAHTGKASHGAIFFAHRQWAGKGQRGRSWASNPGENILLSVLLEPVFLPVTRQFPLNAAIALACHDFFSSHAGPESTRIKWPNDLYWRDRKAGGILIENSFRGDRWQFAIAGIGININQVEFSGDLRNPVSLRQITGRSWDAAALGKELGDCLEKRFEQLRAESVPATPATPDPKSYRNSNGGSPALPLSQLEEYNTRLYRLGTKTRLKKDSAVFETLIEGVSPLGELLTRDTLERRFAFGEVEWVA